MRNGQSNGGADWLSYLCHSSVNYVEQSHASSCLHCLWLWYYSGVLLGKTTVWDVLFVFWEGFLSSFGICWSSVCHCSITSKSPTVFWSAGKPFFQCCYKFANLFPFWRECWTVFFYRLHVRSFLMNSYSWLVTVSSRPTNFLKNWVARGQGVTANSTLLTIL